MTRQGAVIRAILVLVPAASAIIIATGRAGAVVRDEETQVATATLTIPFAPESELTAPLLVDELDPETVLIIRATGFDPDTTGTIRQCVHGAELRCHNQISVRFDDQGAAHFQYLISNDIGTAVSTTDPCRLGAATCTIELTAGDKTSVVDTIFVDESPPPGHLDVTPRRGLRLGDTITLSASGFPPETELTVTVCAEPSTSGRRCGHPGPVMALVTAADGTAHAEMVLDVAEVGVDRVACARRTRCRIVAASAITGVWARPVTLDFDESRGADYDAARLATGLAAAGAMVGIAGWLIRATDWGPPRESDSAAIDEAELADLDAEAAAFDEYERALSSEPATHPASPGKGS